ncbi:MAG: glycoside hydrolase family 9 protein [Ruminococcus sp.]|nr:glycoside hydrolase family 9 protein [Ruminococcus sp.]
MKKLTKRIAGFALALALAGANAAYLPVTPVYAGQMLGQTDFEDGVGLPWHVCESMTGKMEFEIDNGVYKITIVNPGGPSNGGEDRWDCQFRYRGLKIVQGQSYTVEFDITASNNCTYYTKIGDMAEPYSEDWHGEPDSGQYNNYWDVKPLTANQKTHVRGTFTANRTADVEWAFHIGGDSVPKGTVFTFDNMSLTCDTSSDYDYKAEESYQRAEIAANQLGYFKGRKKQATLITDSDKKMSFKLCDEGGKEVYNGDTKTFGYDEDSGDKVQVIDFTDFDETGKFYIEADNGAKSRTFEIFSDTSAYSSMLYDGLNYYYQNRSGIEIKSDYITSGDKSALAREAGHTTDNATIEQTWGYSASSGTQDVSGGWYDAGDHGKYVVNGGLSVWLLNNMYERAKAAGSDAFEDGSMAIPENNNGYPDLLDEARWETEFMLKMMVKDGDCKDMVYHKVHDIKWTALGMTPAEDTLERIIKPPTTCATLNLAACAAQSYRLWKDYDSSFADTCLEAAKNAYAAAKKHPEMYAPLDESVGGGAYGDTSAEDEFYWAACELYVSTGDSTYLDDMKKSKYYLKVPTKLDDGESVDTIGSFDWGHTAVLGNMTLALNKDKAGDYDALKKAFADAADYYLDLEAKQGYGLPYGQSTIGFADNDKGYNWGSNSFVLDNAIVMAYAYDMNGDDKYQDGVVGAMDYILGRNAVDNSYVTGYGSHTTTYPHHRFWSGQEFEGFPLAPNGVMAGGPNSGMEDPWVKGSGWKKGKIAPQKCYLDHIEAWCVNECTINWNAALVWADSFLCLQNGNIEKGAVYVSDEKAEDTKTVTETDSSSEYDKEKTNEDIKKYDDSKSDKSSDSKSDKDSDDDSGLGIWLYIIIGAIVLIALISLEIFAYKIIKLKSNDKNGEKKE